MGKAPDRLPIAPITAPTGPHPPPRARGTAVLLVACVVHVAAEPEYRVIEPVQAVASRLIGLEGWCHVLQGPLQPIGRLHTPCGFVAMPLWTGIQTLAGTVHPIRNAAPLCRLRRGRCVERHPRSERRRGLRDQPVAVQAIAHVGAKRPKPVHGEPEVRAGNGPQGNRDDGQSLGPVRA